MTNGARTAWVDHANDALQREGLRNGSARRAVVDVLGRHGCCRSAREIADELEAGGTRVGVASVYRALEVLDRLGLVHRLEVGDGTTRFEPADPTGEHHHHLVCDRCGRVTAFEDQALEDALGRLSARVSYAVEGHDVVLRGACPTCRATS